MGRERRGDVSAHHPVLYRTGRYGCWGGCVCGWEARTWTTVVGVHLEFGWHLLANREVSV